MNNTIIEMKNTQEWINSRITEAEEWISELKDRMVELNRIKKKNEENWGQSRRIWDSIKHTNIRIIGVPEEEEKKKGTEKIFEEVRVENFPNMGKEIVDQVQEVQRVPHRIKPRRNMPRHILIKLTKIKYKEKY